MVQTKVRTTKYVKAIRNLMARLGHATNVELLKLLKADYPDLSATTIHRITTRLYERGELQLAPSGNIHVLRYDANIKSHDHFMCERCGLLRDANLRPSLQSQIEAAIGGDCSISGSLTVSGICKKCSV